MAQGQPQGNEPNRSTLSDVMERNIRNQARLHIETASRRTIQERIADVITDFSGSMTFVYLHLLWFGVWLLINSGWIGLKPFDPFPFSLLTLIVSLEAIFLSTFLLISQNRSGGESDQRAELALQVALLTEHEVTRVLQMIDAIQEQLGISNDRDSDLAQLEVETRPEDVLAEIDRLGRLEREQKSE